MKNINGWFLPENDSYFSKILSESGSFEPERLRAALQHVKNFRCAIDAGAHIGLKSRELSPRFSSVYSFEPVLETYGCLIENISSLSNITCFNVALGNEENEVAMRESSTRPGNSGSMFVTHGAGTRMRTLDSFGFQNVDFIKIDCENYEYFVLLGAKDTIHKSHPVILIEVKNFRDTEGRIAVDYLAASRLLEEWGMHCVEKFKNDRVYVWPEAHSTPLLMGQITDEHATKLSEQTPKTFGQYTSAFTGEDEYLSPHFEENVAAFYAKLLKEQEPLGKEFEQVLHDNFWDLLIRT